VTDLIHPTSVLPRVTERCRVCFRRIPEELILRAHSDPDWIAANSVQTGEEVEYEDDMSDDSSSRLFDALLLFARILFGGVVARSWLVCNTVNSLPEDADSTGTESDGDKEEGDSDDEEDDAEILEDDEGEGELCGLAC
jgi:hypothetical protein